LPSAPLSTGDDTTVSVDATVKRGGEVIRVDTAKKTTR
jgi:hypothetical protein